MDYLLYFTSLEHLRDKILAVISFPLPMISGSLPRAQQRLGFSEVFLMLWMPQKQE